MEIDGIEYPTVVVWVNVTRSESIIPVQLIDLFLIRLSELFCHSQSSVKPPSQSLISPQPDNRGAAEEEGKINFFRFASIAHYHQLRLPTQAFVAENQLMARFVGGPLLKW